MLLEASNISKSFGDRLLFENGNFSVEPADRIGLIGENGCGKTTIFKMIMGEEECDTGGIVRSSGVKIGVLRQQACLNSEKTCYQEALSVFDDLISTEEKLEALNTRIEKTGDTALIEKADRIREEFLSQGGLTFRSRTRSALIGLGLKTEELDLSVNSLSGGQRSKVEIAKLLLSAPDIMLLDEPTNHLDIDAIEWLDGFIKQSRSAVIIISHDRYFLDRVANKILSIEHKKLYSYPGNYTKHLELRAHREETVSRQYDNTMREVKRIEGIIEQQKRWNREKNIKTAESKQKQIDRLLENLEIPEAERKNMTLRFSPLAPCPQIPLAVKGANCSFGDTVLYRDVSFEVQKGERVFIIGKNGCGKTTLLKSLKGGEGKRGAGVTLGYFDQHTQNLSESDNIFSHLRGVFPRKTDTEIRGALALFLFKGDDALKPISQLSGGERARVALCELMLKKDNLLLLDEPTNHLDLPSREILESALEDFEGTIIAVSHDRYFINRLASRIFCFENGTLRQTVGNYDTYLAEKELATPEKKEEKTLGVGGQSYKKQKEEASRLRKLKTAIEKCEQNIADLEEKQKQTEEKLSLPENANDYQQIITLSAELEEIKEQLLSEMEKWESLCEEIQ